jgi:energy-converting hydrogenase Eha subunit E
MNFRIWMPISASSVSKPVIQSLQFKLAAKNICIVMMLFATAIALILQIGASSAMAQHSTLSALRDAPNAEVEIIADRYRAQRESDIQELINIVEEQRAALESEQRMEERSRAWFALALLGDLRADAAVPILTRLIAVKDRVLSISSNETQPHWYSFPAAVALAKIGMPAVGHLLETARGAEPTSTAFQLCGVTLEAILGEELALAAVEQYARYYPELSQQDRLDALKILTRTGHKRWSAFGASDFRTE